MLFFIEMQQELHSVKNFIKLHSLTFVNVVTIIKHQFQSNKSCLILIQ